MKTLQKTEYLLPLPPEEANPRLQMPEPNPLAAIAGSYADDPHWDEFLQDLEDSRRAMDEAPEPKP